MEKNKDLEKIRNLWQSESDKYVLKAATKDLQDYSPEVQKIILVEKDRRGLKQKPPSPPKIRTRDIQVSKWPDSSEIFRQEYSRKYMRITFIAVILFVLFIDRPYGPGNMKYLIDGAIFFCTLILSYFLGTAHGYFVWRLRRRRLSFVFGQYIGDTRFNQVALRVLEAQPQNSPLAAKAAILLSISKRIVCFFLFIGGLWCLFYVFLPLWIDVVKDDLKTIGEYPSTPVFALLPIFLEWALAIGLTGFFILAIILAGFVGMVGTSKKSKKKVDASGDAENQA